MSDYDIAIGAHTIWAILNNNDREIFGLYCSSDGLSDLKKSYPNLEKILEKRSVSVIKNERIQEFAESEFKKNGYGFNRIPGNIFLKCSKHNFLEPSWLLNKIKQSKKINIVALDQVTDVHNGAAILRTASFFNFDALILPQKGSFNLSPNFYRTSSGATECVPIVKTPNLSKTINLMKELNVACFGFSERGEDFSPENLKNFDLSKVCLVHGAEDLGISNAVSRSLSKFVSLRSFGQIKTLNVSVASAISMEKLVSLQND